MAVRVVVDTGLVARSVWGEHGQFLALVLTRVARYASEFGHAVASDDLFLLAVATMNDAMLAPRALADARVDVDRLRAQISGPGDAPHERADLVFAPACYAMLGRAEAFAATLGDGTVASEHVLLALIWDPTSSSSLLLREMGVSREQIVESLAALGAAVPTALLPAHQEVEWGERVSFEREQVGRVIEHLGRHLPPGSRWRFNFDGDRAWAVAQGDIDLRPLIHAALR